MDTPDVIVSASLDVTQHIVYPRMDSWREDWVDISTSISGVGGETEEQTVAESCSRNAESNGGEDNDGDGGSSRQQ